MPLSPPSERLPNLRICFVEIVFHLWCFSEFPKNFSEKTSPFPNPLVLDYFLSGSSCLSTKNYARVGKVTTNGFVIPEIYTVVSTSISSVCISANPQNASHNSSLIRKAKPVRKPILGSQITFLEREFGSQPKLFALRIFAKIQLYITGTSFNKLY